MRRLFIIFSFTLIVLFSNPYAFAKQLNIIAGTSLIEDIISDLTDNKSNVLTVVSGSSCPGHENIKTADMLFMAKSNIMFLHSFQKNMPQIVDMLKAANAKSLKVHIINISGSWLIPDNQKKATEEIARVLSEYSPSMAISINKRAEERIEKINAISNEISKILNSYRGKSVIVAKTQEEFVRWAGFEVVATFGRAETMVANELTSILQKTRDKKIVAIVENYQSGAEAGLPLAQELKVSDIILSNFPGSNPNVPDYFSLLKSNVQSLTSIR